MDRRRAADERDGRAAVRHRAADAEAVPGHARRADRGGRGAAAGAEQPGVRLRRQAGLQAAGLLRRHAGLGRVLVRDPVGGLPALRRPSRARRRSTRRCSATWTTGFRSGRTGTATASSTRSPRGSATGTRRRGRRRTSRCRRPRTTRTSPTSPRTSRGCSAGPPTPRATTSCSRTSAPTSTRSSSAPTASTATSPPTRSRRRRRCCRWRSGSRPITCGRRSRPRSPTTSSPTAAATRTSASSALATSSAC